jgi:glycosyltransferase involved in cell wall biosynthesis
MRILTFSTLYPNTAQPGHGVFVETQLRQMLQTGAHQSVVVAPVPWFPSAHPRFGRYAVYARVPREEERHGVRVLHPRYPVLPKIGMTLAPLLLARSVLPAVRRLLERFPFDVIDAHYFYPDGVAAVMLGRRLGKPVVISALGTDVNVIPGYRLPRRMILWAARHAGGMITVARALKERLVALGVPDGRIEVLRNGVDLRLFRPVDREMWRRELGFRRTTLLSVGNLVTHKGHDLAIRALALLPDMDLVVVGSGPERASLAALAHASGLADRVSFVPVMPQEELRQYFGSADALVLASSREGWANVLLESMACGTPVIASRVGGTPEVVTAPQAGVLMAERTPQALAEAARRLFDNYPDRAATRRYAEEYSWDATTERHLELFQRVVSAAAA